MATEQGRLEYFDKENQYLDAPVDLPRKKDSKGQETLVFDENVFFRPPLGIRRKFEDATVGRWSYRYLPSNQSRCLFQEVRLAVAGMDKQDFWKDVLQPFPGLDRNMAKKERLEAFGRNSVEFEKLYFEGEGSGFFIFVGVVQDQSSSRANAPKAQIAVTYRLEKSKVNNANVKPQIDYSLRSLGVAGDATRLRRAYASRANYAQ